MAELGKWEITLTVIPQKTNMDDRSSIAPKGAGAVPGGRDMTPFEEKYTVEKPTEAEAMKEAIYQANKVIRGMGPKRGPHEFKYKSSKVLKAPGGASSVNTASSGSDTDVKAVAENILNALSNSNEFAGLIAEVKNLEKLVSKLGGAGKVFTGASIAADLLKYYETFVKLSQTTDQNKKKELMIELLKICASLTKTTITIAFPPAGIIDAAISTICVIGEQVDKALEKKFQDKVMAETRKAMQEKYDKEGNALKPNSQGYQFEVGLYTAGFPMPDILERRKALTTPNTKRDSNPGFTNPYKKYTPQEIQQRSQALYLLKTKYGAAWPLYVNKS